MPLVSSFVMQAVCRVMNAMPRGGNGCCARCTVLPGIGNGGIAMKQSIDMQQRLTEIEHALSRRFASPSTSVTHLADSAGRMTIQVSWVESAADMNILDARCALSVVLASRTMSRYASMSTADRVRVRERLCDVAREKARDARRTAPAAACNATLDVSEPMLDEAAPA
jgi:hypothetical protein